MRVKMANIEEITADAINLIVILRNDPYFSYIINATPAVMVCLFGGLVEIVSKSATLDYRGVIGGLMACIMTGIVMTHLISKLELSTGSSVVLLLFAGYSARPLLDKLGEKIISRIAQIMKGDF